MLDLGPRGRTVACAVFFGSEAVLIATAGMRTDRSYGFRMFPEASSIVVHLSRRLADGQLVAVGRTGRWETHDCSGARTVVEWSRMVRDPAPQKLESSVGAPYGVENEVQRTSDAMRWVLGHTPGDCETRALVATVDARKNGRPPYTVDLEVPRER
jgi:hypothetical protein